MELKTILASQALFAIGCAFVADRRGGLPLLWFILGAFLGPFAFAVALTAGKRCKYCMSWIPKEASVCRDCSKEQ